MLPRTWLNRIFSFNNYSVETGAFGDLKPGNDLIFPPNPLHPNKNTPTLDVPINSPSRYTRLFFLIRSVVQWNNSPFQWGEMQETSAKNCKNYLENRFRNNMDCISPSERFESHIYLNYWVNRTITTGDLRRDLKKEKVAKIMFSFISWNLHEGWDEWFHFHSTHQQQETP